MSVIRAMEILKGTFAFLGSLYGDETCTVTNTNKVTQLQFNPQLSPPDSACSRDMIDR